MSKRRNTPTLGSKAFDCPCCGAYSQQTWYRVYIKKGKMFAVDGKPVMEDVKAIPFGVLREAYPKEDPTISMSACAACNRPSLWVGAVVIYPEESAVAFPVEGMPDNVRELYLEARAVFPSSPRAAAALLRLALDALLIHLGAEGKFLDSRIASLQKKGIYPTLVKAMDIVRIAGNNAVHPAEIDLHESPDTASQMFDLLNLLVEQGITVPARVDALYSRMPENKRRGAEQRGPN